VRAQPGEAGWWNGLTFRLKVTRSSLLPGRPRRQNRQVMVQTIDGVDYVTMDEACAALGVKPATLYAYVSRGKLRSYRQGIRRQRLYARAEVEKLARLEPSGHVELPLVDPWTDVH
jgi:excisionase family DNA binding protein